MNNKVLDGWKQLKGFCISITWVISSLHMLTPAAGATSGSPSPPISIISHNVPRGCQTPANTLSVSLTSDRTLAPDMVVEECCCKVCTAGCLTEATLKGELKDATKRSSSEAELMSEEVNGIKWLFSGERSLQSLQCFHDSQTPHLHITQL